MQKGHFSPWIRPDIIKQITRGACNRDQLRKRLEGKTGRLAMTPMLMDTLKTNLGHSSLRKSRKRILWAVATICWAGALRIHEILSRLASNYDPLTTLLTTDIKVCDVKVGDRVVDTLKITIKHPKEERLSAGVVFDVFATKDFMCPVKAFRDWQRDKVVRQTNTKPMFRLADGQNYTGAMFNRDIKRLLRNEVDYDKSPITSHSFRAGLATFMAKSGYSDEDIMTIGRWHSGAFLNYIKTPREVRAKLAEELADKVSKAMKLK